MPNSPATECMYVEATGHHIFESRGLDVRGGRLVRVRECVDCGTEKLTAYRGRS